MASGSSSRGHGSGARGSSSRARAAAEAPAANDAALLAPQLNPTLVAMPAAELVAHLNRYRRTADFVDAALVFAAREHRLAEAEGHAREGDERTGRLLDEIRAREYSALEVEAQIRRATETEAALRAKIRRAAETEAALRAKIRRAAETEVALRDKIRTLKLGTATLISSGISGGGLTMQQAAAGHGLEPVPQDFVAAGDDGVGFGDATGVAQGKVGDDVPMKMRHAALRSPAPHLVAAPLPDITLISDDESAAAEQVATDVLSSNEDAQGDSEVVSEDVLVARALGHASLTVTAGGRRRKRKVSEEEAQGEDVAASSHRRSQGEQQAARATKKAPRRRGMPCFYNDVLGTEKQELLIEKESLAIAKAAADAAAPKQLHCRCGPLSAPPYMPSKSEAVEKDSGDAVRKN